MNAKQCWYHFAGHLSTYATELEERRAVDKEVKNFTRWPTNCKQSRGDTEKSNPTFGRDLMCHFCVNAELRHEVGAHTWRLKKDALLKIFQ